VLEMKAVLLTDFVAVLFCLQTSFHRQYTLFYLDKSLSNSSMIHQVEKKEILTVTVFGHLILVSIDFYAFISPFSPYCSFDSEDILNTQDRV